MLYIENFDKLECRVCTLEQVAPHLLGYINDDNFAVAYTLVPYMGVSMIDYRFRLNHDVNQNDARYIILRAINDGKLKELFAVVLLDNGLEEHKFTRYSAVFVKPSIKIKGRNLYISAYFDNENLVNRFFNAVNYISGVLNNNTKKSSISRITR